MNWQNIKGKEVDPRISGRNLLDNRDPVAGQWLRDTYRPRGNTVMASLSKRF